MNKLKLIFGSLVLAFSLLVAPLMVATSAYAVDYTPGKAACSGANGQGVQDPTNCPTNTNGNSLPDIVGKAINIFSWVVGAVSVIMLIYGGFKYITSGGDSGGVTAAKNTILYAIVGLVIVALSQIIVNFVLTKANDAAGVTTVTTSSRLS